MNNSTCINVLKVWATAMVYFCHSWIVCLETFDYKIHGLYKLFITPAWAGVWIFLVVGGYLAAHGFYSDKYDLTARGVKSYYKNRIFKILIPTWIFISLGYIFIYQEKTASLTEILQWLTCTFNGSDSIPGIGASWYVFIVMWLYLLTPFIFKFIKKIEHIFPGREFNALLFLLGIVIIMGGLYRILTYFFLDWYNWTYANILGCFDLFISGFIAYRLTYFTPMMNEKSIYRLRIGAILAFFFLVGICLNGGGMIPYGGALYKYVWPSGYLVITCSILMLFSYSTRIKSVLCLYRPITFVVNIIAPYSFAFYLWHSFMLMYVAQKLNVADSDARFLLTTLLGLVVSSYIAFLMTKMNNGIIKSLSNI